MRINRNNYEAFFILYMDNELSPAEKLVVEEFVKRHPDLEEELELLQQTRLEVDAEIVFEEKSLLLKDIEGNSVSDYEEDLLLYADNELDEADKTRVEELASVNPVIKKELDLLMMARLEPESISFPDKSVLYRTEEVSKVVTIRWWRIAAAAAIVLAVGGTLFFTLGDKGTAGDQVAVTPAVQEKIKTDEVTNPIGEKKNSQKGINDAVKIDDNAMAAKAERKNKTPERIEIKKADNNLPQPENMIASNTEIASIEETNFIVEDANRPIATKKIDEYTSPSQKVVKRDDFGYAAVTNESRSTLDNTDASNKKIRGFLRKATRVFERTTKISVTDEDDRLLIGGLAVKL